MADTRATTLRLPASIYEAARAVARRRRISLNRLLQDSLRAALDEDEGRRLREAFEDVARDIEDTDVEFALPAQREVVTRAES